jgi:hypothetical protein
MQLWAVTDSSPGELSANQPNAWNILTGSPCDGALSMDGAFHDADGKPGFNFADRGSPHGWKGSGSPHGAAFSH